MVLLLFFAFVAGIVTVLSPCALPLLPILLAGGTGQSVGRPWGIVTGFVGGFVAFTLLVTTLVQSFQFPVEILRYVSAFVVGAFGLALLVPALHTRLQLLVSRLVSQTNRHAPRQNRKSGYLSGVLIGLSLGLAWSPCVGPIMASVLTLSLTQSLTAWAVAITFAYAVGTGVPLLAFMLFGQRLLKSVPWLSKRSEFLQRLFAGLMVLTAVAILLEWDRSIQTWILQAFPDYGAFLTGWEEHENVQNELERLKR